MVTFVLCAGVIAEGFGDAVTIGEISVETLSCSLRYGYVSDLPVVVLET
jgi:hypothetical protein